MKLERTETQTEKDDKTKYELPEGRQASKRFLKTHGTGNVFLSIADKRDLLKTNFVVLTIKDELIHTLY